MNTRQEQLLKAIIIRCTELEQKRPDFRGNARERIAALGFMTFDEVMGACERGCRASFGSIFGKSATDAERMKLHRDLAALEREGFVTLSKGDGRQRYVRPSTPCAAECND